jgi:hypothetical protein
MRATNWATLAELVGFLLTAYGLLRESFATLNQSRAFGAGRYDEGTYGGAPTWLEQALVRLGVQLRLLPRDRQLTLKDRKRNAALAIAGVLISALALAFEVCLD